MSDEHPRGFASDNNSGAHPEVLEAIAAANDGHVVAYGDDDYTARARECFRDHFGPEAEAFMVFNGTGANVLCLQILTRPYEAVICPDTAHLNVDECGAPERIAGVNVSLGALSADAGVDVLSFGGTKNGLLIGDAVVFLRLGLARDFLYVRKQSMQLASKMRFLAAQFEALLAGDLWLRNASHANAMARRLAEAITDLDGVELVYRVEANGVFANLPRPGIDRLRKALPAEHPFYVWDDAAGTVRLMCSWDTTEEDVDGLASALMATLS